jgi:hypothetical protein
MRMGGVEVVKMITAWHKLLFFKFQLTFSNANGEFKMTTAWRKLFFEDCTINFLSMNYFIVKLYIFYFQPTILFL